MIKFITIKIPPFGGAFEGEKLQIILPDGRDVAPDLHVQSIEVKSLKDDFCMVTIECCAQAEVKAVYPYALDAEGLFLGRQLAEAVKHSGWK